MRQLAHLADIERQLLAPLQTLLGDAQAVLRTELDSIRLEEADSATSLDLPVATPSDALATELEAQRAAKTPVAEVLRPESQGRVASPRALALRTEQAASTGASSAHGLAVPSASAGEHSAPVRPAGRRVHAALAEAGVAPIQLEWSSPVLPGTDRAPYLMPPKSILPMSARHTAGNDPSEMEPLADPQAISTNAPSTTSAPPPLTALRTGTELAALRATAHSSPISRTAGSAPGTPLPGAALAALAADGHQTRHANASAPVTAQPRAASQLTAAEPSHRLPGIPLRPRQVLPPETSFAAPHPSNAVPPDKDSQAAARRFAATVEPSLEQAYRLSQARLDTARLATTEAESSSLVRNTFNVTVALAADNANAALDPATLEDALTDVLRAAARRHGLEL